MPRATVSGVRRSCARAATSSRLRLSASHCASSESRSEARMASMARRTSSTCATLLRPTSKSRSHAATRAAASTRGSIFLTSTWRSRTAHPTTHATNPATTVAPSASSGLGSESRASLLAHCETSEYVRAHHVPSERRSTRPDDPGEGESLSSPRAGATSPPSVRSRSTRSAQTRRERPRSSSSMSVASTVVPSGETSA